MPVKKAAAKKVANEIEPTLIISKGKKQALPENDATQILSFGARNNESEQNHLKLLDSESSESERESPRFISNQVKSQAKNDSFDDIID